MTNAGTIAGIAIGCIVCSAALPSIRLTGLRSPTRGMSAMTTCSRYQKGQRWILHIHSRIQSHVVTMSVSRTPLVSLVFGRVKCYKVMFLARCAVECTVCSASLPSISPTVSRSPTTGVAQGRSPMATCSRYQKGQLRILHTLREFKVTWLRCL